MLNVSLTFYLGTCWAAKACLRMGRRSSLSSPKSSLYSIYISSIYRSCRGRNRVPYSPPCPQPEHPALLQLPNIHSLIWWRCPLPHSQATPKESMILPSSNHGNPAWKSQLLSILKISVFQLPLFGFRFWHLHSEELSCSPFLWCLLQGWHQDSPASMRVVWYSSSVSAPEECAQNWWIKTQIFFLTAEFKSTLSNTTELNNRFISISLYVEWWKLKKWWGEYLHSKLISHLKEQPLEDQYNVPKNNNLDFPFSNTRGVKVRACHLLPNLNLSAHRLTAGMEDRMGIITLLWKPVIIELSEWRKLCPLWVHLLCLD